MAESLRSLVLVENETYELIDGDGNFYVSKTNLGPISPTFSSDPFSNFSNSDLDGRIPSVVPPQSNMEPILINDYGKMNFFTQANANVTIYLNTDNVIDLTTSNVNQTNSIVNETNSIVNQTNLIEEDKKENQDLPEFIDLSQLKIPYSDLFLNKEETINEKQEEINNKDGRNEDDVVFVKEYTIKNEDLIENSLPLDLRSKNDKIYPEPRRNPKRTVQILKEYYSSFKYNPDFYAKPKRKCCESKKKPGAVFNPPNLLTNEHFKEWPVDMHEKPTYNITSKKLEMLGKEKKKIINNKKIKVVKKPFKKGKRKMKNELNDELDEQISKQFATLTHETFQEVIGYVQQIKDYKDIIKNNLSEDKKEEINLNFDSLKDLLVDSCVLYSIAHDVSQKSVSKYLKTIKKDIKL